MRSLITQDPFTLFAAIVPIREGQSLDAAVRKAEAVSRLFFANNQPSGPPELNGIWTAGTPQCLRHGAVKAHSTLVYTGADRNQLSIFEKPDEAVGLLESMLMGLAAKVEEVDLRTPAVLFYGDKQYHVDIGAKPFDEATSPSVHVTKELAGILDKYW